jgi:hypothetical protein
MQEPFPVYVDEVSHDKIKATVSDTNSFFYNLRTLKLLIPGPVFTYTGERISKVSIMPMGRFICMLVGYAGNRNMILLDLIDKEELAEKIAEKLSHAELKDRFMQVYREIMCHPENHGKCELVLGKVKGHRLIELFHDWQLL